MCACNPPPGSCQVLMSMSLTVRMILADAPEHFQRFFVSFGEKPVHHPRQQNRVVGNDNIGKQATALVAAHRLGEIQAHKRSLEAAGENCRRILVRGNHGRACLTRFPFGPISLQSGDAAFSAMTHSHQACRHIHQRRNSLSNSG